MVEVPGATTAYILTPNSYHNPSSLATGGLVEAGALVVDLGRFPPAVYRIGTQHDCIDVTEGLVEPTDYWTVAREWLAEFTGETGIQDVLAIRGFGFWWTLNGQKFVAGLKDLGNSFAWIDLLAAIRRVSKPSSIIVYGRHDIISYLIGEVFGLETVQIRGTGPAQTGVESKSPRKYGLLVARLFLGILYFFYSLVRNPDVCVISNTNFLRRTLVQGEQRLYDVYLGGVSDRLWSRGWRVAVMEKYGPNASWAGFMARGFFFPSDLVFALSTPVLRKLGLYRQTRSKWNRRWEVLEPTLPRFLKYKGYDIAPLVLPMIKVECTEHGPDLEAMIRIWRGLFKIWQPKLLYVSDSYSRSAFPAIVAARSLNIETAEQQHGVIGHNHIAYLVPRHLGFESKFPLCETMVAWGEHTKSFLINAGVYEPEQIAVCGFPRIDQLLGVLPPRRETRDKLGIPPGAPIVLYTSNGFAHDLMPSILDGLALIPEHSDTNWVVKLHPRRGPAIFGKQPSIGGGWGRYTYAKVLSISTPYSRHVMCM